MKSIDHYWGLVGCFIAALAAYVIMAAIGHPEQGTLLRAVILTLGGGVGGAYISKT